MRFHNYYYLRKALLRKVTRQMLSLHVCDDTPKDFEALTQLRAVAEEIGKNLATA